MFFITTTTLLTFLVLGMTKLTQSAKSEITYQSGWTIPNPLQIDQRTITLVADPKQYEVVASNYNGRNASDAQCQTILSQGHYSGPCLTNVTKHNQVFNVHLISNVSNAVSVTFFANSSLSDNQAQIITAGNCFGGFTNEDVNIPLHQSGTSAIVGQGDRIGVLINCINNKRGPTLITNSNSSPSQQPTLLLSLILTFSIFIILAN